MEQITEVLQNPTRTTHTETSHLQNSDEFSVLRAVTLGKHFDFCEPLKTCEKCGDYVQCDKLFLGEMRRLPIMCKCKKFELQRDHELDQKKATERRLQKFKAYSLMDERFTESTFANWENRVDNVKIHDMAQKYCDNWEYVSANNKGLLLHGKAGNGKTYASFAIANELYVNGETVLAISVSRILQLIKKSFNNHGEEGEIDILNTLGEASLLILDDLGVEYKTHWSYEKLYAIVDARYSAKNPLIITTNLTIEELRKNLAIMDRKSGDIDESHRIYNRIVEMCAFIEVGGESWRIKKGEENTAELFRELGVVTQ